MKRLLNSFSGGETSGFMSQWVKKQLSLEYGEIITLFANTGQENEETLDFVDKCDKAFGLNVVWLEAEVQYERGKGTRHKVVSYETASRNGEPFEAVIKKYGIANQAYPHCTRELKLAPMTSYLRSIGWQAGSYDTAVGIRVDEIDRMSAKASENRLIYPLVGRIPMTKPMINHWWSGQSFRLGLKGYQGNCKWCWKKSLRKHLTLITENPQWYDFPQRMEKEYGLSGSNVDGNPRVFFRSNMSTQDLREIASKGNFDPATDDASNIQEMQSELDFSGSCSESCEVTFD